MEQIDMLFDPVFQEDQQNSEVIETNKIIDTINILDFKSAYQSIITALWHTGMPCTDSESSIKSSDLSVLKYCEWQGKKVPCADIFLPYPTDQGICCTFNMKAADLLLVGETYPQLIKNFQNSTTSSEKNEPLYAKPGKNKGLLVVLDLHSDSLSASSLDQETQEFFGVITQSRNFPQVNISGFDIKPGHKTILALSATIITTENIENIDKSSRNCYFEWESNFLKIYQNYTQSNCMFECNFFYAQKILEKQFKPCLPWYFPSPELLPNICDPWQAVQMSEIMSNVPANYCISCLPDCVSTILKTRISTAPLRKCQLSSLKSNYFCNNADEALMISDLVSTEYQKRLSVEPYYYKKDFLPSHRKFGSSLLHGDVFETTNVPYRPIDKDIAVVQIFFRAGYATKILRSSTMNWIDYFSNIGGIFGLVLGMGLITIAEIFWLSFQYFDQFNYKLRLLRLKNTLESFLDEVKEQSNQNLKNDSKPGIDLTAK
jgi:hypothetical protein